MARRALAWQQIINMSLGLLGIQFAWILQILGTSIIFTCLGISGGKLGLVWLTVPLSGLLVQWYLDQYWQKPWTLDTRNLFILIGALLAGISLMLLPNTSSPFTAILLLWVLNIGININLQPYAALATHVKSLPNHTFLLIQNIAITIGCIAAALLVWILSFISFVTTSTNGIPWSLKYACYIGGVVLLSTNIWTIFTSLEFFSIPYQATTKKLSDYITVAKLKITRIQFFSWLGLFCFFIYYTQSIAQNIFTIPILANSDLATYQTSLQATIKIGSIGMIIFIVTSFWYSYLTPTLHKILTLNWIHAISLVTAGICLMLTSWIHDSGLLLLSMFGVGIGWSSITTIPIDVFDKHLPNHSLGLFNLTIWFPQIIITLLVGILYQPVFSNHAAALLTMSGVCMLIAAAIGNNYSPLRLSKQPYSKRKIHPKPSLQSPKRHNSVGKF